MFIFISATGNKKCLITDKKIQYKLCCTQTHHLSDVLKKRLEKYFFIYQIVDDIEAVIFMVLGVDASMIFLPHVILQCGFISEGFLAVQAL